MGKKRTRPLPILKPTEAPEPEQPDDAHPSDEEAEAQADELPDGWDPADRTTHTV